MADLDHVKPTLPLKSVRALLDAVAERIVPQMQDAQRVGDLPEADLLAVHAAQKDVRTRVDRSHRARVQAANRPPGPKLTRVPDVRFDPDTGQVGDSGRPVYVFAKPGEVDHA